MRAATEGSLPPVMPQGNLVEVLGGEVRQGSPGELMVESSRSRQRWPPCKTNKDMSDEAADAAALTYLLTYLLTFLYTEMPKFGGYDFALVVICALTRFTRVFPCTKHITGEETIKILLEEWFCVYGAPKEINSDGDVRVRSDTGWYKRVLRSLNVQVSTGIPYSHTGNPLCERQIRVLKQNVRI